MLRFYCQLRPVIYRICLIVVVLGTVYLLAPKAKLEVYNKCLDIYQCPPIYGELVIYNSGWDTARDVVVEMQLYDYGFITQNPANNSDDLAKWAVDIVNSESEQKHLITVVGRADKMIQINDPKVDKRLVCSNNAYSNYLRKGFSYNNTYLIKIGNVKPGSSVTIRVKPVNIEDPSNKPNVAGDAYILNLENKYNYRKNSSILNLVLHANKLESNSIGLGNSQLLLGKIDEVEFFFRGFIYNLMNEWFHDSSFNVNYTCANCWNNKGETKLYMPSIIDIHHSYPLEVVTDGVLSANGTYTYSYQIGIDYLSTNRLLPEKWNIPLEMNIITYKEYKDSNVQELSTIHSITRLDLQSAFKLNYSFTSDDDNVGVMISPDDSGMCK
jgi:hypothetical protein